MSNPYFFPIALVLAAIAIVVAPWVVLGLRGETSEQRAWIVAALGGALAGLVYLTWIWEVVLGLVTHVAVLGAFVVFGLGLTAVVFRRQRSSIALGLGAIFVIAIVALHHVDLSPRKPYRRFFEAVQAGMTPAEVRTLLDREFPTGSRFRMPHTGTTTEGLVFNLDLQDGRYNAETIYLTLRDGRVATKRYSGD